LRQGGELVVGVERIDLDLHPPRQPRRGLLQEGAHGLLHYLRLLPRFGRKGMQREREEAEEGERTGEVHGPKF
jgi:hypothetical protein